ncbi:hypothetical protein E2C01_070453 [Portunus trituberculatus]|uniref:Uncharacterized protein n=1 Tax=Portunus trituberculatus TaxID=210409 RepID=A0A5B7HXC5_PORTR|nr:hypothetical protein [Portunus trituberculatus]
MNERHHFIELHYKSLGLEVEQQDGDKKVSHPGGRRLPSEEICGRGKRMSATQTQSNSIKMFTPARNEVTLNRSRSIDPRVRKDPEERGGGSSK